MAGDLLLYVWGALRVAFPPFYLSPATVTCLAWIPSPGLCSVPLPAPGACTHKLQDRGCSQRTVEYLLHQDVHFYSPASRKMRTMLIWTLTEPLVTN